MNLVLDFGNTRLKAALFKEKECLQTLVFDKPEDLLSSNLLSNPIQQIALASVTQDHITLVEELKRTYKVLVFNAETPIPLKNLYQSPATLGSDRILASIGSYSQFPDKNVLTIDAGTCIKYNFVNSKNEFLGGAISPGIQMRLKAMHHYTAALPDLEIEPEFDQLIGDTTRTSMLSGAQIGAIQEVQACINIYFMQYPTLQVVLTGGDAGLLSKRLKKPFFANPNSVLTGLNTTLLYQAHH
ncbi:MAG TPA: type III pantothenate kinase [Bacteroidia bacterium]|nr:type III pantothenate kinase [Bacteroidia bacterium]